MKQQAGIEFKGKKIKEKKPYVYFMHVNWVAYSFLGIVIVRGYFTVLLEIDPNNALQT